MVLLLVAFNIASSKELSSPAEKEETSLHIIAPVIDAVTFTADKKRFLRTQSIHAADVGHPDEEERAYAWATKLGSLLRKKDPVKLEEIVEKKRNIVNGSRMEKTQLPFTQSWDSRVRVQQRT
ncbi:hypothetical protein PPTG_23700 [Phytophthora nicotianae INRA-310]|uniref:RxLR effector protein n=1 Tax=Phytophthora nicotianae (strain INRA-310) TaxID=761204 RepID=W2PT83_PHYN3|nr:hypothetical protein PPTG_23700 [Phytophthora nicotianae INRA-310]ETN03821.1 hypothetical protein PPTG_23700 [Phytophthora nicotianae INRA-310]